MRGLDVPVLLEATLLEALWARPTSRGGFAIGNHSITKPMAALASYLASFPRVNDIRQAAGDPALLPAQWAVEALARVVTLAAQHHVDLDFDHTHAFTVPIDRVQKTFMTITHKHNDKNIIPALVQQVMSGTNAIFGELRLALGALASRSTKDAAAVLRSQGRMRQHVLTTGEASDAYRNFAYLDTVARPLVGTGLVRPSNALFLSHTRGSQGNIVAEALKGCFRGLGPEVRPQPVVVANFFLRKLQVSAQGAGPAAPVAPTLPIATVIIVNHALNANTYVPTIINAATQPSLTPSPNRTNGVRATVADGKVFADMCVVSGDATLVLDFKFTSFSPEAGETTKRAEYRMYDLENSARTKFVACVVTTQGEWGEELKKAMHQVRRNTVRLDPTKKILSMEDVRCRVAVAVAKANRAAMLSVCGELL